jgi:hypothetical protein
MIHTLYNKYPHSTIAIVGSGPSALKYSHKEDIGIALNGALSLDAQFDYFEAFDIGVFNRSYYYHNIAPVRIIGAGLAAMDTVLYPDKTARAVIRGHTVLKVLDAPVEPHLYFRYEKRSKPIFDRGLQILSASGNIVVCAIETALIMGASELHLYGVGLSTRKYFYENAPRDRYPTRVAGYVNDQLALCESNGVTIRIARDRDCAVKVGVDL